MPHPGSGMLALPCPIETLGQPASTSIEAPHQLASTSLEAPQQPTARKENFFTDYAHASRKARDKLKHYKVDKELHEGDYCECFLVCALTYAGECTLGIMKSVERIHLCRSQKMGLSLVRILRKRLLTKGGAAEKWALWFCKEYASNNWFTWYIAAIYEFVGDHDCPMTACMIDSV